LFSEQGSAPTGEEGLGREGGREEGRD